MKAQDLRDKLAGVRDYNILIDGKFAKSVSIDKDKKIVNLLTTEEKKEEVKK
jgi:hypothetical protein